MTAGLRRTQAAIRRNEATHARREMRTGMSERRARTRRLIELGGLVARSGVEDAVALHDADTRAVILGALLTLAESLRAPVSDTARARVAQWRARGREALRIDEADPSI